MTHTHDPQRTDDPSVRCGVRVRASRLRKQRTESGHDAGADTIAWHLVQHHGVTTTSVARTDRSNAGTYFRLLVQDLDITIINATTGEILRELVLDTTRDYQPIGRPPGPTKQ